MCYKVICGQKALEPVPLRAVGFGDNDRWCPFSSEALEILRPFFDVDFDGNEVLVDEARDLLVRINLGIQPGASCSHGRSAKVQHDRLMLSLCLL
jgi:hypothetical protein